MNISAIISDYDGTLCPTQSVRTASNKIPEDLYQTLSSISSKIPICILSSKDYFFLHDKVDFAKIISCVNGLESFINLKKKYTSLFNNENQDISGIDMPDSFKYQFIFSKERLIENSSIFLNIVKEIENKFQFLMIDEKHCYTDNMIMGITFDYRENSKWELYKETIEPKIVRIIQKHIDLSQSRFKSEIMIQQYKDHPFIDVYSNNYDKGLGLIQIKKLLNLDKSEKILYLGDSENDNPAFRVADLSISINSTEKLSPKLDSHYALEFNQLRPFLNDLENKDFYFSRMNELVI